MILGFIGTGKISSSIIYGIFNSKLKIKRIYISSRNKNIAKKLNIKFRSVKILKDNQEIIDKSSTIFLGVTPDIANKILAKLKFAKNKKIISLISTINLQKLKKLTKNKNVVRAIPLPPIEIKKGPIILCPGNKNAKAIFSHLGQVIDIKSERICNNFWATSALMAPFYELLKVSSDWLTQRGVQNSESVNYITELFLGLSQDAVNKKSQGLKKLVLDSQTPRGINEQALSELKKEKFYRNLNKVLDRIHLRIKKSK